jgi:hypothetical protein
LYFEKSRNMHQKLGISWIRARREPQAQVQVREPCDFARSRFGHMKIGDSWCRAHPLHSPLAILTRCRGSRKNSPKIGDLSCRNDDSGQKNRFPAKVLRRAEHRRRPAAGVWQAGSGMAWCRAHAQPPKTNIRPLSRPTEPPLPTIPEGPLPSKEFGGFFGSLGSLF